MFEGLANNLRGGGVPGAVPKKPKTNPFIPKKKGKPFTGLAKEIKAERKVSFVKPKLAPEEPIAVAPPATNFTPPKQALAPVFKVAGSYLPGGPSAKPLPAPVTAPAQAPIAPRLPPTVAPGPRKSLLPTSAPVSPSPQATGQFAKFAPIVNKTANFLPKVTPKVDKIEPAKPSMFAGLAKNLAKASSVAQKVMQGPAGYFTPDLTQKSAKDIVEDTKTGFKTGVDNAKVQYANLADKTTNFYKTAYLTPGATNAEKTAAAMDFAASLITDAGGGTFGVALETASGFSPGFKYAKENTLDKGSELATKAGQFVGEEVVPILPVSDKTKELIKGPTERLTTAGLMALAFGVAGRAASKSGGKTTIDVSKKLEDMKTTSLTPNEVVSSAKEALGIESNAGQQTRTPIAEIRERFDELNRDPNVTPEELQVANVAKQVLDDYARLPQTQFLDKYKAPLAEVQKAAMRAPSVPDSVRQQARPEAPKPEANKFVEAPRFEAPKDAPSVTPKIAPKVETKPFIATASAKVATEGATKAEKAATVSSKTVATKAPAVPKVEPIKPVKFDSKNLVHKSVLTDILGAETAAKVANTGDISSGVIFGRRPDSLPKWIPSELRRGPLVKSVMQHINDGTLPVRAAENQLYRVIANQMNGDAPTFVPGKSRPKLPTAKESAPTKITLDEANPKHFDVLEQMANAKAGVREGIQTEAGRVQTSTKSTFPKWIPENLRQKPLLDAVSKHIYDGTIPTKPNEIRLYKIASEQMGEGGLTKAYLDAERANLYDPFATAAENAKILADFDRIAEGGSAAAVKDFVRDFGKGKSKIGKSIEAKAIEKGLAESFSETAGYSKINIKDQAERASKLVANNLDDAKKMLMGDKELPDGLRAESLILALEEYALKYGDTQLALDIANSPLTSATSLHAQAMRIMAERNPDSAVAAIQKLKKMKEEAAKKTGKTKANVVKDIKESVNKTKRAKATKETWGEFINNIAC